MSNSGRKLAPHVQAAIARGAQAKVADGGRRTVAPHVQAAIARGAQAKVAKGTGRSVDSAINHTVKVRKQVALEGKNTETYCASSNTSHSMVKHANINVPLESVSIENSNTIQPMIKNLKTAMKNTQTFNRVSKFPRPKLTQLWKLKINLELKDFPDQVTSTNSKSIFTYLSKKFGTIYIIQDKLYKYATIETEEKMNLDGEGNQVERKSDDAHIIFSAQDTEKMDRDMAIRERYKKRINEAIYNKNGNKL